MLVMDPKDLKEGLPEPERVVELVRAFAAGLPRLHRLLRYYQGRHDILGRVRAPGQPNARLAHGFPRYIAQAGASYLLGESVRYEGPEPATGAFRRVCRLAQAEAIDLELAIDQAVYGQAVSLCYVNRALKPGLCALDPRNAFLVYDGTVEEEPLFGVRVTGRDLSEVTVYTDRLVARLRPDKRGYATRVPHPFGVVPMTAYRNSADCGGDFEPVLGLVDAYDLLASDRVNDRRQFADALLVLTGVMGLYGPEGETQGAMERLRQERILVLPDRDAKAEFLVKSPNEQDAEVLRRAISEDIHKFSQTPDFADERFAGNSSGIAIKYKLFHFENRIRMKERWFVKGLQQRAQALCGYLRTQEGISLNAEDLMITLPRRLPVNELERAQALALLKDILPKDTLRQNAPLLSRQEQQEQTERKEA